MRNLLKRESVQIALVLILGLGGISFIVYSRTQHRAEVPAAAPVAAPTPEKKSPTKPDDFFPSPAPRTGSQPTSVRSSPSPSAAGSPSEMTATPGCVTPGALQAADSNELEVLPEEMKALQDGEKVTVILNESSKACFRKNDSYSLYLIRRDQISSVVIYRQLIGKARIANLQEMAIDDFDLAAAVKKHVDFIELKDVAEKAKDDDSALFISIVADGPVFFSESPRRLPAVHPQATTVDKKMLVELKAKGALVVDLRSPNRFAFKTIPGAINMPLGGVSLISSLTLRGKILIPSEHPELGFEVKSLLPTDTKTPIILFAGSKTWLGYNAVSILASFGYKNLYWYSAGFQDWLGIPRPPSSFPGVGSIAADELANQVSKKRLFIVDVRRIIIYQNLHIPSASPFKFKANVDLSDTDIYRPLKPTLADLKKNQEGFAPADLKRIPVDRTIVVVGTSDQSWTAFKAAAELALRHYSVKLLRGGMDEYSQDQLENPEKYPIEPIE
jgi:rhodanese-related sulfurtransferase